MSEVEREQKDKELRASGKISRPIISPKVWNWLSQVPLKVYLIVAVLIASFFAFKIAIREARQDARNMAVAEMAEKQADESLRISNAYQEKLRGLVDANAKLIADLDKERAQSIKIMQSNRAEAIKKKNEVLSHTTTAQVSEDVQRFLKLIPESFTDTSVTFNIKDTQQLVLLQIAYDQAVADNEQLTHQLAMEKQVVDIERQNSASKDELIAAQNTTIKDMQVGMNAYKTASKKSGFQKFLGVTKDVAKAIIPALIVAVIMQ